MKVKVVDSIMGSGKTSAIINMINKSDREDKFIYITPYLDEVARIEDCCKDKNFKQPISINGSKLNGIKRLLINNHNIVSTHSLFHLFDDEIFDLIHTKGYKLIMDEVTEVIEQYSDLSKSDVKVIFENNLAHIDENNYIIWDDYDYEFGKFSQFKHLCEVKALQMFGETIVIWLFPIRSFEAFDDIYILTYMFNGQIQKWYYDFYNVEYEYYKATKLNGEYIITLGQSDERIDKSLINICLNRKLNDIGELPNSLSKAWYQRSVQNKLIVNLKSNTENYFKNITNFKSEEALWTKFKDYQKKIKGKGYTKGFIPLNLRASNAYRSRFNLAYLCNKYVNPVVKQFFEKNGINVDEDAYALSEMLQWIWRSAIRDGKPINIYIPSKRMRTLLMNWLEQ